MTPPPADSPQVPKDAPEQPRHDTAEVPVTVGVMRRAFRWNELYTFFVAVATAGAALLGGYKLFISEARAAGAEEAQVATKKADSALRLSEEVRLDVRALYLHILTGQRQERLERPLPEADDGGPR